MKEIKIDVPDGYEIDKENSTFERIKFKKKEPVKFRGSGKCINGFYISNDARVLFTGNYISGREGVSHSKNVFATQKQAKSALAMAQLSQIIANDERFGGPITDEEWNNSTVNKYCIIREGYQVRFMFNHSEYKFLAFHTKEQRDLFLEENEDLIRQYLMLD